MFIDIIHIFFTLQYTIVHNNKMIFWLKDDKIWGVLRDDFGMGAKLKDWDKKDTEEEDSSTPNDMDSDD